MASLANLGRCGLVVGTVWVALVGCGQERALRVPTTARPPTVGAAAGSPYGGGLTGGAGAAGQGGSGFAGDVGAAGTAGPDPTPGAGGAAGAFDPSGASGQGGLAMPPDAAPPPLPSFCDGMPQKPLPYAIATDFTDRFVLNAPAAWVEVPEPDCNQAVFPDVPSGSVDGGVADAGAVDGGPAPSVSSCDVFEYAPDTCVAGAAGLPTVDPTVNPVSASCWAGMIFTPSPGLGGPGICIAPGANVIRFKARSSREGARVKFGAIRAGLGQTEFFISLTTAWADYTISIPPGESYDDEMMNVVGGVWNGFSVVAEPQDHVGGSYIFVSDVVWATQ